MYFWHITNTDLEETSKLGFHNIEQKAFDFGSRQLGFPSFAIHESYWSFFHSETPQPSLPYGFNLNLIGLAMKII